MGDEEGPSGVLGQFCRISRSCSGRFRRIDHHEATPQRFAAWGLPVVDPGHPLGFFNGLFAGCFCCCLSPCLPGRTDRRPRMIKRRSRFRRKRNPSRLKRSPPERKSTSRYPRPGSPRIRRKRRNPPQTTRCSRCGRNTIGTVSASARSWFYSNRNSASPISRRMVVITWWQQKPRHEHMAADRLILVVMNRTLFQQRLVTQRRNAMIGQRVHASHLPNSFFTNGVSRVRLYWSPSLRMASPCVG